ncbi:MAG: ankyrin repeat domain-containing protein [Rhodanobacter sp.]|nr:MAG: ankyrin repeat domain-containing protein [Rhodanobacter sp.]
MRIDLDSVRQHLADGGSPDKADQHGRTVLSHMAGQGRVDIMTLLLEHGADVEQPDDVGDTPLSYAAVNSREATLLLLEYGAEVDAPNALNKQTPLMGAAYWGCVPMMEVLLAHGAQVDARTAFGSTVLMNAARNQHIGAVAMLLDRQADVNTRDPDGNTALHHAVMQCSPTGQEDLVRLLLARGANPELVNKAGAFAENLAQGAAREVLVAERVVRERALLLGDFTAPIARRRSM